MPYDLYGTYYASARDAENAEMAQCAAIEAGIANRKVAELERQIYRQQEPTQQDYAFHELSEYVKSLEARIEQLEEKFSKSLK